VAAGDGRRHATLEDLAAAGIRFTILAPHQAARVRRIGARDWQDVSAAIASTRAGLRAATAVRRRDRALLLRRPDVPRRRVRGLLRNGEHFASACSPACTTADEPQLATSRPTARRTATTTATARWPSPTRCTTSSSAGSPPHQLRRVPRGTRRPRGRDRREHVLELRPRHRALAQRLRLPHRRRPGWHQRWRGSRCATRSTGCATSSRPASRKAAGTCCTIRGPPATTTSTCSSTARRHHPVPRPPRPQARRRTRSSRPRADGAAAPRHAHVHELRLVLQRVSGIETVQVLQYAGRAVQLARSSSASIDLEGGFLERLERAEQLPEARTAREHLRGAGPPRAGGPAQRGRPLRRQLALRRRRAGASASTATTSSWSRATGGRAATPRCWWAAPG
jgi:hypothetical protein